MRILIIGGTRFMGPFVVRRLHELGHEVTVFHRGRTTAELPSGVGEMLGDRNQIATYREAFEGWAPDVVLDMMLLTEEQARELMATFKGVAQRVVVASSMDVYQAFDRVNARDQSPADLALLTEESPLRPRLYPYRQDPPRAADDPNRWQDDYDKILVEREVMSQPTELPGTIVRLPAVYGPGDSSYRLFAYLKRMDDQRPAILLDEGEADWRWTYGYVENVADALVLATVDVRAAGRIYHVGETKTLSNLERVQALARLTGWSGEIVSIPREELPEALRMGIDPRQPMVADTNRIRRELGYVERVDQQETFRRTIAWDRAHPPATLDPQAYDYALEDRLLAARSAAH